jgi:putative membrane protein
MAKPFLTDETKAALTQAVRSVEGCSSAELVVAVRPKTGLYLHADLIVGIVTGLVALAVLLYSRWSFELVWFLIDPVIAGVLAGLAASRSPMVRRVLTPARQRRERVEAAARATFVEKRVHVTSGRTGMLLYVSVLEREAVLMVDAGVEVLAATDKWREVVAGIEGTVRSGGDGAAVAARLRDLEALLKPALLRSADDIDELPNEVC